MILGFFKWCFSFILVGGRLHFTICHQLKFNLLNKYNFPLVFNNLNVYDQDGNQYYPSYDVQSVMNSMIINQYTGVSFNSKSIKMDFNQVKESFTFTINGGDYE